MFLQTRRLRLKGLTARAHKSVEATVGPLESLADYRRYLSGTFSFRAPLEDALQARPWPRAFGDWRPVLIGHALWQDMADLKIDPIPCAVSPIPCDLAGWLGALYVLEGSSLGAHLIYPKAKRLGLQSAFGARHLGQQMAFPGSWKRFLLVLEQADPIDFDTVVRSAQATFVAIECAFREARTDPPL